MLVVLQGGGVTLVGIEVVKQAQGRVRKRFEIEPLVQRDSQLVIVVLPLFRIGVRGKRVYGFWPKGTAPIYPFYCELKIDVFNQKRE